ncbi:ABC transporter ATP-binding protein [Sphingomonas koreensis]|uniref:ABC transporter ATP-binding protein n=1 Tax=Sphingomonas koreensis TaxID=93064 RepID=UPI00082BAA45|nr:ABC transporter ATP-binding protein [Sphingomonas koreensis]PJI88839.1 ATP-binding cassette subfamily B protein [Sphingomonas koreensis]RSU63556.1 ABC transporter ATP-binding protein [Sphingomonas koreensis]RSU64293.1 ABC transporter ATP-binding protein [Sphingomonas koreensis]
MTQDTDRTDSIRRVLGFAFRHWVRQPGRAAYIAFFITAATVTEIFVPLFAGRLIDALAGNLRSEALALFAAMASLGLAMVVLRHFAWAGVVPFTLRMMRDVTQDGFHRVQRFSTDWHANSFAGSTVRKITRGMWAFDTLNDVLLLQLLPSIAVLGGTMLLLGWHWPVLGVVMAIGAVAYVAMTVVLATRWASPAATLSNAWDTKLGGMLSDAIGSNAVVKAFGAEEREEQRIGGLLAKWAKRTRRTWMRYTWSGSAQIAVLWAIRSAITGTALWLWWTGAATPGDVTFVLASYFVVHGYLVDVGFHIHHMQRAVNEMEELVDLHDQPLGIDDRTDAQPIHIGAGEVHFDDVTFRYGGHETPLYEHLTLTIRGGERVGLVGHSGSGKTTFVKLIQRLYDVNEGRVTIDGQDVSHATQQSLRAQIAIVQQEPILFHRSLADNIAYARPGASQAEVEAAARLANAHDFIVRLPRGYATLVGERGVKLSGGERQRVALARAFLADAPILILDEATSSLDSESEALIQQAMDRLMKGRTAIVIAHRLSTVRTLDRILVFDKGRIIEDGDHDTLLVNAGGQYRRLFDRQSGNIVDDAPKLEEA